MCFYTVFLIPTKIFFILFVCFEVYSMKFLSNFLKKNLYFHDK